MVSVPEIEFEERVLEAVVPNVAAGGGWMRTRLSPEAGPLPCSSARLLTDVTCAVTRKAFEGQIRRATRGATARHPAGKAR